MSQERCLSSKLFTHSHSPKKHLLTHHQGSEFLFKNKEKSFTSHLEDLKSVFLIDKSSHIATNLSNHQSLKNIHAINPEAKTLLQDTISQIVSTLGEKLKKDHMYQLLPQSYFEQQIGRIRLTLLNKLNEVEKSFACNDSKVKVEDIPPENQYGKGKSKLSKKAIQLLKEWYMNHIDDPYPNMEEKAELAKEAQITMKQVNNWFVNTRGRTSKSYKSSDFNHQIRKKLLREHQS